MWFGVSERALVAKICLKHLRQLKELKRGWRARFLQRCEKERVGARNWGKGATFDPKLQDDPLLRDEGRNELRKFGHSCAVFASAPGVWAHERAVALLYFNEVPFPPR